MRDFFEHHAARISPEPNSGCWLWTGAAQPKGYGTVWSGGRYIGAHVAAYTAARGPVLLGGVVRHTCDMPCCVNPDHLLCGTYRDNMRDMYERGRSRHTHTFPAGAAHPLAKLTEGDVREIRSSTERPTELARKFGVSYGQIWLIRTGRGWRHIT